MGTEETKKECFIVTPIGAQGSETRRKLDGLLDEVLSPVLSDAGYNTTVSHKISKTGSITRDIIQRLVNADLVIADLSGLNPNVMYELAIRHSAAKPVISIAVKGTEIPFDVADQRAIPYEADIAGLEPLRKDIRDAIKSLNDESGKDNPVHHAIRSGLIDQWVEGNPDADDFRQHVLEELRSLKSSLQKKGETKGNNNSEEDIWGDSKPSIFETSVFNSDIIGKKSALEKYVHDLGERAAVAILSKTELKREGAEDWNLLLDTDGHMSRAALLGVMDRLSKNYDVTHVE